MGGWAQTQRWVGGAEVRLPGCFHYSSGDEGSALLTYIGGAAGLGGRVLDVSSGCRSGVRSHRPRLRLDLAGVWRLMLELETSELYDCGCADGLLARLTRARPYKRDGSAV